MTNYVINENKEAANLELSTRFHMVSQLRGLPVVSGFLFR